MQTAARTDAYAIRWDNACSGKGGWMPAVRGGWRRGLRPGQREYLPLTTRVITEHLSGDAEVGLYPMLDGDRCHWLAADFDGRLAGFLRTDCGPTEIIRVALPPGRTPRSDVR
jgi:hypothetical protein